MTTSHARRAIAAVATTTVLAIGSGLAFGGDIAAADPDELTSRSAEPATGLDPVTIRFLVAVATCTEMYPRGTDITDCLANLY